MTNKGYKGSDRDISKGIGIGYILRGTVLALFIAIIICSILGIISYLYEIPEVYINVILKVAGLLSIFIGSVYTVRQTRSMGWLNGGLVGLLFIVLAVLISQVINPEEIVFTVALSRILVGVIVGAVSGIVALNI